jgi:hypothetical protein
MPRTRRGTATSTPRPGVLPHRRHAGQSKSHAIQFELGQLQRKAFSRADLLFDDVDHAGPSFEARVFLNNPAATAETPRTIENGYAGSFHIFGHGYCFGGAGHCEVDDRGKAEHDLRDPHPLTPAPKLLVITDALKQVLERDGKLEHVAIVPVAYGQPAAGQANAEDFLKYDNVRLVTYD